MELDNNGLTCSYIVVSLVAVVLCWYILILLNSPPTSPAQAPAQHIPTFPFPTIRGRKPGQGQKIWGRKASSRWLRWSQEWKPSLPKTSGKLNYFCLHTVFLEVAVSQQGDLLLRQQFGFWPRQPAAIILRNYAEIKQLLIDFAILSKKQDF